MIPYAELERALQRWKARAAGEPVADAAATVDSDRVAVDSDRVSVDASYVESEAEDAFPTQNAGTNEIIVVGEPEES